MASGTVLWGLLSAASGTAFGYDRSRYGQEEPEIDADVLREEDPGEAASVTDFFRERIKLACGFDEAYFDNFFLQDNNKQNEYVSTLEGEIFFADNRGDFLYGMDYEANAFRYHRASANAIDHDVTLFLDYDPKARARFKLDYTLDIENTLLFGLEEIDVVRRSSGADFQRIVTHRAAGTIRYALNETNELAQSFSYTNADHQIREDAESDSREWSAILDLDHDLRPEWTIFSGYQLTKVEIPGNTAKGSDTHSIRLGTRYELTEITEVDLLFEVGRQEFEDGKRDTTYLMEGKWSYQAGPRTQVRIKYANAEKASFQEGRRKFRSNRPAFEIDYALSPLVTLRGRVAYERQTSDESDVLAGSAAEEQTTSRYDFQCGVLWQWSEQAKVTADYRYSRSPEIDTTSTIVTVGFEKEF